MAWVAVLLRPFRLLPFRLPCSRRCPGKAPSADRLAEDYLALSLTGHDISGCPPDPWTDTALAALLICIADTPAPGYTPRAVTFLTAATARWPHLGTRHLYPLLRQDPGLALRGGSTVLTTLDRLAGPR